MSDQICVYGTSWCGQSRRSIRCLESSNVEYVWFDIDKDLEARAFVEKVNNGNRSVPTILFPDGSILVEPSDAELVKKFIESE